MDLSILQAFIPDLAGFLNLEPATLLLYLTLVVTISNLIGRVIPDDKTGLLGVVRDICKILGAYTPNRVASGVSVNDVARSIVSQAPPELVELAESPDSLVEEVAQDAIVQAFPGLNRDPATGKFAKHSSGESN